MSSPAQTSPSQSRPISLTRPLNHFRSSPGPSGTSTPRTIPVAGDTDDQTQLISSSSPSSLRKTGSGGEEGTSVSPEMDGFLALHTTLSAAQSGPTGSSLSLNTEPGSDPMASFDGGSNSVAEGVYTGGVDLSHASTAPQPSTATLSPDENGTRPAVSDDQSTSLPQSPTRPSFSRSSLVSMPPVSTRDHSQRHRDRVGRDREGRGSRLRASTASLPTARLLPMDQSLNNNLRSNSSRPQSTSSSPAPQSSLQSHLYNGLLNATLSDLHIVAFGHLYRLHRIVLAGQSGFFTSLLSGGFSEERQSPLQRRHNNIAGTGIHDYSTESVVSIELDEPMTRAAFEFCLAKLYGGGPTLHPPAWARATPAAPLSESFETLMTKTSMSGRYHRLPSWATTAAAAATSKIGQDVPTASRTGSDDLSQLASPDFLLSLLATSTYLEIPSVQHLALETIQTTLTPWTVGTYLAYATGRYSLSSDYPVDEPCRGLEGVGIPYQAPKPRGANTSRTSDHTRTSSHQSNSPFTQSPDLSRTHEDEDDDCTNGDGDISVFVGPEGERVGEACACWLAKWGGDVLSIEESEQQRLSQPTTAAAGETRAEGTGQSDAPVPEAPPLRLWSSLRGGLSARWVRGVISSDAFFLATKAETPDGDETGVGYSGLGCDLEFHRYLFAKRVVQMRRRERQQQQEQAAHARQMAGSTGSEVGQDANEELAESLAGPTARLALDPEADIEDDGRKCGGERTSSDFKRHFMNSFGHNDETDYDDEDEDEDEAEIEYRLLFSTGIRFTHMTFRQLQYISQDQCPITGESFVPQSVIERAFWRSETSKYQIPISVQGRNVTHYIYGSGTRTPGGGELNQIEEHPELGLTVGINSKLDVSKQKRISCWSTQPFYLVPVDDTTRINERLPTHAGVEPELLMDEAGASDSPSPQRKHSTLPRGAEGFFGLGVETRRGTLGGPKSAVVFGSSAEEQLERRFVAHEPFRTSVEFWLGGVNALKDKQRVYSSTFFFAGSFYNLYLQKIQKKGSQQLGIYLHRQNQNEPFPIPSQPPSGQFRLTPSVLASLAPYTDRRKSIKAFFSIWCPNVMGNSLTRFSSGPDTFALSQSWGWKSTSLSSEFLTAVPENTFDAFTNRLSSLRVTVVIGLV